MFLHLPVILFMGGGGLHPGGSASRGVCIQGGWQTPPRALRDTINKRTVRVLLECILVVQMFIIIYWVDFLQNALENSFSVKFTSIKYVTLILENGNLNQQFVSHATFYSLFFVISDNHIYWANFYIEPNLFHVIDTIIIMEPKLDYINLGKDLFLQNTCQTRFTLQMITCIVQKLRWSCQLLSVPPVPLMLAYTCASKWIKKWLGFHADCQLVSRWHTRDSISHWQWGTQANNSTWL